MTIVRELLTVIGYDVDSEGAKRAEKIFDGLKKGAAAVVAGVGAGTAALILITKDTADFGDQIAKTAVQINIGAEALQELQFAGQLMGVSIMEMETGLRFLSKNLGDAAQGSKGAQDTFDMLGVSITDATGKLKASETVLGEVAQRFEQMPNDARKTSLSFRLFGRAGVRIAPLLSKGSQALEDMRQEARSLGGVLSEDTLRATEDFQDANLRLQVTIQGMTRQLGGKLIPIFAKATDKTREWMVANKDLIERGIDRVVDAVEWMVDSVEYATRILREHGRFLTILAVVIIGAKLLRSVQALTIAFNTLTMAQIRAVAIPILMGAAFIALAAIIALVIEDVYAFVTGGESAIGNLFEVFVTGGKPSDHWVVRTLADIIWSTTKAIKLVEQLTDLFASGYFGALDLIAAQTEIGKKVTKIRAEFAAQQPERRRRTIAQIAGRVPRSIAAAGQRAQQLGASAFGGPAPSPATAPAGAPAETIGANISVGGSTSNITVQGSATPEATAEEVKRRVMEAQADDRRETSRLLEAQGRIRR